MLNRVIDLKSCYTFETLQKLVMVMNHVINLKSRSDKKTNNSESCYRFERLQKLVMIMNLVIHLKHSKNWS